MLECPLDNPIRDKLQSLFEKAILGSLKFFFNWSNKLVLASTSQGPPHSATLGN